MRSHAPARRQMTVALLAVLATATATLTGPAAGAARTGPTRTRAATTRQTTSGQATSRQTPVGRPRFRMQRPVRQQRPPKTAPSPGRAP